MSLLTEHANSNSIDDLGIGLLVGSLFILPALGYLYYAFKKKDRWFFDYADFVDSVLIDSLI